MLGELFSITRAGAFRQKLHRFIIGDLHGNNLRLVFRLEDPTNPERSMPVIVRENPIISRYAGKCLWGTIKVSDNQAPTFFAVDFSTFVSRGSIVSRRFSSPFPCKDEVKMDLVVTATSRGEYSNYIECGAWTFDAFSGAEIDDELDCVVSFLNTDALIYF